MVAPFHYTRSQIDRIGNTIIYLATHIAALDKTKLLMLVYLIEEIHVKKYGFPFFNIRFDTWKIGPISKDLYLELTDTPDLLHAFIALNKSRIEPKRAFDDGEFSDNDLKTLDYAVIHFGNALAPYLVNMTQQRHSAWYKTAVKNGLLDYFKSGQLTTTDIEIDFSTLLTNDQQKAFYLENKALYAFSDTLKI